MHGKILTIAGSDPSGGAGIQADIKTISALGGYAMAAITALTVQNTRQVYEVHPVDAELVAAQVRAVLDDITPDAIKVGMMGSAEIARQLAKIFAEHKE
ncbi:MAG TPA: bifunctional hydroxymethylpyrimidine kinase/phosphomethylpyrimidine kinase, partial [Sphingomonadales bacterium]|nr:bifunctional hydroxymethylpyrimidine kinase/phosphomethylpyrimidine kinase [Sphingomonadales bacterium]